MSALVTDPGLCLDEVEASMDRGSEPSLNGSADRIRRHSFGFYFSRNLAQFIWLCWFRGNI